MSRFVKFMKSVFHRCFPGNTSRPVPGKDAEWVAHCDVCAVKDRDSSFTSHVSRGGYFNGGVDHCYECGTEKVITGHQRKSIDSSIKTCKYRWLYYPRLPYNWHLLSEEERLAILRGE